MRGQDRRIVPAPLADKLLECSHLAPRSVPGPKQAQGDCLDVLAGDISNEQAAQVGVGPHPLFAPPKERGEAGVIGRQFGREIGDVGGGQRPFRRQCVGHINGRDPGCGHNDEGSSLDEMV